MENMNWLRQTEEPLFPDILWSRPENKRHAGKLLIIGGHKQSFNAVSAAYSAALKAGIGTARVILPDKLQKTVSKLFPEAEYAPSNEIGSFSRQALAVLMDAASWADGVLLAGDFGRNSETAILLESFTSNYNGKMALAGDTLDYFQSQPGTIAERKNTLIITSLPQAQKLASPDLIQQKADFIKVVEQVQQWVVKTKICAVTVHSNQVIVACGQQISATAFKTAIPDEVLSAYSAVWFLQQPAKPFKAVTTAAFESTRRI
jgi:NAD(P)H-hydrate repair Nnr-like enzyme with NAD(P)H-hydrate dehydratase domain